MVSKMIETPKNPLEILKFRFSLHMVSKMIDPPNTTGDFKV